MKLNIGKLLAIIQILLGIWYFDWHSWSLITVSIILFLSGILGFLPNPKSKFLTKSKTLIQIITVTLAVILIIKTFLVE